MEEDKIIEEDNETNVELMKGLTELASELTRLSMRILENKELIDDLRGLSDNIEKLDKNIDNIKEKLIAVNNSLSVLKDSANRLETIKTHTKFEVIKSKDKLIKAARLIRDVRDEIENLAYLDGTLEEYEKSEIEKRFNRK